MKINWNIFKLMLGITAISFSPLVVKQVSFGPTAGAFYRSLYAAAFLLAWSVIFFKREFGSGNYKWLPFAVIGGVSLGIDLIIWHRSILYLGAGPATFLGNSQIIFVVIFAALVFKEKITLSFGLYAGAIMLGLYLLIPDAVNTVTKPTGYIYGLIVGLTYAVMLISMRYAKSRSGKGYPEILSLCVIFAASAAAIAFHALFLERATLAVFDLKSHVLMALTALFAQAVGWYLIKTNITKIPAHEGSLLLILQPILATIWGIMLFKEPMSAVQFFGVALASAGIALFVFKTNSGVLEE